MALWITCNGLRAAASAVERHYAGIRLQPAWIGEIRAGIEKLLAQEDQGQLDLKAVQLEQQRPLQRREGAVGEVGDTLPVFRSAIDLYDEVHRLYEGCDDAGRRLLSQALFEQILIEDEADVCLRSRSRSRQSRARSTLIDSHYP